MDDTEAGPGALPLREAAFVEAYLRNGGHGAAAAREVGYKPTNAASTASTILAKPNVRELMRASWEKLGLTPEAIGRSLLRNLDAKKGVLNPINGDVVDVSDPASQVQAANVAAKVLGLHPDPRFDVGVSVSGAVVVQHLAPLAPDPFAAAEIIDGEVRELAG